MIEDHKKHMQADQIDDALDVRIERIRVLFEDTEARSSRPATGGWIVRGSCRGVGPQSCHVAELAPAGLGFEVRDNSFSASVASAWGSCRVSGTPRGIFV